MNIIGKRFDANKGITGILLVILFLIPALATADGMAFRYRPASSLEPLQVNEQRAVIAHKDGIQRMFIAINLQDPPSAEDPSRSAVWIFPIPGTPETASVDVTAFIPDLKGQNVEHAFREAIRTAWRTPLFTQLHFFVFEPRYMRRHSGLNKDAGVTTHKVIDRWGTHAELIRADSVDHLADYLRRKDVGVADEHLSLFEPYLSDKHVLVLAWISSYEEFIREFPGYKSNQSRKRPALFVEFPTDKPFYPMLPTSGYGKSVIKISLYLVGWLRLDMQSWLPSEKKAMNPYVTHYVGDRRAIRKDSDAFLSGDENKTRTADIGLGKVAGRFLSAIPNRATPFTHIEMETPAENFTKDFWFLPDLRVSIMHFVAFSSWGMVLTVILVLLVPSYISGGISGKLVFGEWKPWARTGLWNCFTIVGLFIATWLKRRETGAKEKQSVSSARREAIVFGALIFATMPGVLQAIGGQPHDFSHTMFVGLILLQLFVAGWIVWTIESSRTTKKGFKPESAKGAFQDNKPEATMLAILACTPVFFLVTSLPSPFTGEIIAYGLITGELLIAAWVVWQGATSSMSTEAKLSQFVSVAIAVPLMLLPLLCAIVLAMAKIAGVLGAVFVIGLIILSGIFLRKRLQVRADEMTNRTAHEIMLVVLSVLAYLAGILVLKGTLLSPKGADWRTFRAYTIAAVALILGTWVVKRALAADTAKALRFAAVFTVVFTILYVGGIFVQIVLFDPRGVAALRVLFPSLGILNNISG